MPAGVDRRSIAERFRAGLEWLDCLIEREVLRLRGRYELSLDELRGLYVSDARVDDLLRERLTPTMADDPATVLARRACELHANHLAAAVLAPLGAGLDLAAEELDLLWLASRPSSTCAMNRSMPT